MRRSQPHLKSLLGIVFLSAAVSAAAAWVRAEPDLAIEESTCDQPVNGKYSYVAKWKRTSAATSYEVNTRNQCRTQVGASLVACDISTKGCTVACEASGNCVAELSSCLADNRQWLKVSGNDGK